MIELPDLCIKGKDDTRALGILLSSAFNWTDESILKVSNVSGGITNTLLLCRNTKTNQKVLIRVYGKSTDAIIVRQREIVAHRLLHSLGLASELFAKFGNGILYGFIEGEPLNYTQLEQWKDPIATHLALLHSEMDLTYFQTQLHDIGGSAQKLSSIWPILQNWVSQLKDDKLNNELEWLISKLDGQSPLVACHSDLLAGNIIITKNGVAFIDYEYLMAGPRAFDIANHFMEWQGFNCEFDRVPSPDSKVVRDWCNSYLKKLGQCQEDQLDQLVKEVKLHYGLPGFFWGVWSKLQHSISEIDFDYNSYSTKRLTEYYNWKQSLV